MTPEQKVNDWKINAIIEVAPKDNIGAKLSEIADFKGPADVSSEYERDWDTITFPRAQLVQSTSRPTIIHVPIRSSTSEDHFMSRIQKVQDARMDAFLVSADDKEAAGPLKDSFDALRLLKERETRLRLLGFPCYPHRPKGRGHPLVTNDNLFRALDYKLEFLDKTKTPGYFVMQTTVFPEDSEEWLERARKRGLDNYPVYMGILPPQEKSKALWYLIRSGVRRVMYFTRQMKDVDISMLFDETGEYSPQKLLLTHAKNNTPIAGIEITSRNDFKRLRDYVEPQAS